MFYIGKKNRTNI